MSFFFSLKKKAILHPKTINMLYHVVDRLQPFLICFNLTQSDHFFALKNISLCVRYKNEV